MHDQQDSHVHHAVISTTTAIGMYLDQCDLCTCAAAKELPVNNIHKVIGGSA